MYLPLSIVNINKMKNSFIMLNETQRHFPPLDYEVFPHMKLEK